MKKFRVADLKVITPNYQYEYKNWVFFATDWTHALHRAKERHKDLCLLAAGVNPEDYIGKPLYVVYGPTCFPQLVLLKVMKSQHNDDLNVWGYSVYRNLSGFRTLGISLHNFVTTRENARFYTTREYAFERLAELIPEDTK